MKALLTLSLFIMVAFNGFSQSFVSPIGFVETDANKAAVIAFIKQKVYDDYSKIGMTDPSTLKMMEGKNLDAFKELIKATNTTLLQQVIKQYCDIGMGSYDNILMMYKKELEDSKKELKW
jgi:hypothetical protein